MTFQRASGVLMHISSLPGPYGIGNLGQTARDFIDFLQAAGQSYWQILPVGTTGLGNSPYQSYSSFAGNPLLIDPEGLYAAEYITQEQLDEAKYAGDPTRVDYTWLIQNRITLLKTALNAFRRNPPADYDAFCQDNAHWLEDYALFMAIRDDQNGLPLERWETDIRTRRRRAMDMWRVKCADGVAYYRMEQYFFYSQWRQLRAYAARKGVRIIGDLPIYVSGDSADVWANAHCFALDAEGRPKEVAGCPPDAFSEDGQLWGNPVYDWKTLRRGGYRFWMQRLKACMELFDVVRIDHFRGFAGYFCIPAGAKTAREGVWRTGPGMHFWQAVQKRLGELPIIAEDLGFLTPDVHKLLKESGFPGMKILQFAFNNGAENDYLPHRYTKNSVVYTGTHDNDTILGWTESATPEEVDFARRYLGLAPTDDLRTELINAALASVSDLCILTLQDLLILGGEARMNTPSTVGGNWEWRATAPQFSQGLAVWLKGQTALYERAPKKE